MSSEQKPRVVFRCDGGTDIGMGHVVRCMALAEMLEPDFEPVFILRETVEAIYKRLEASGYTYETLPAACSLSEELSMFISKIQLSDLVVLDGYHFRTEYQKQIKSRGAFLLAVDDLNQWHHVADIVINHAAFIDREEYDVEPYTLLMSGFDNALLRREFYSPSFETKKIRNPYAFMISMGAGDTHNLTYKYAEVLCQIDERMHVHLLVSDINPHLDKLLELADRRKHSVFLHRNLDPRQVVDLILSCTWAICPASTISMECCAVGIGLITGYTAVNQKYILTGLAKNNLAVDIGDLNKPVNEIDSAIRSVIYDRKQISEMMENQLGIFNESRRNKLRNTIIEQYKKQMV